MLIGPNQAAGLIQPRAAFLVLEPFCCAGAEQAIES